MYLFDNHIICLYVYMYLLCDVTYVKRTTSAPHKRKDKNLENIIQTSHWEDFEDKLNEVRGVVQWESDKLFVFRATNHNWDDIRRDIGRITQLVSYYELKEATSTFELALWKFKFDQADATNTTNRAAYRIDVPGPVKDTILQYLDCN